jgi:threonine/homoserine/homoserine lactone efflux protein
VVGNDRQPLEEAQVTISHALITFIVASGLLTITPGLDTMLVVRTATIGGRKQALAASFGICLGLLIWGICTSVGLGALLNASRFACNVLRIAGACYLIFLGYQLIRRPEAAFSDAGKLGPSSIENSDSCDDPWQWFGRGLFTNFLYPKVGLFYVTFLPLFIPAGSNVVGFSMLLASIHALEGIVWFSVLVAAVRPFSVWLRKKEAVNKLDYIMGTVFVGFGVKLLFADRR